MPRGDEEEEMLLQHLQERRRSMVRSINASGDAPTSEALRELAELQGAISAVEAVLAEIQVEAGLDNPYLHRGLAGSDDLEREEAKAQRLNKEGYLD